MNYIEVINQFKVEFDRIYSLTTRGYEDDEIFNFVNQAMDNVVDELFSNNITEHLKLTTLSLPITEVISQNKPNTLYSINLLTVKDFRHYYSSCCYIKRSRYPLFGGIIVNALTTLDIVKKLAQTSPINSVFFFNPRVAVYNAPYNHLSPEALIEKTANEILMVVDKNVVSVKDFELTYCNRPLRISNEDVPNVSSTTLDININLQDVVIKEAAKLAKFVNDPSRVEYINQGGKQ